MKRIILTLLAVTTIAAMSFAAIAETIDFTNETTTDTATATEETTADNDESAAAEDTAGTSDSETALEAAEDAYRAAKQSERLTEYEAELKSMVEAGTLTQEQADLLLANAKEQASLKNGECPNCGYEFSDSNAGRGGHGLKGGKGFGGRH